MQYPRNFAVHRVWLREICLIVGKTVCTECHLIGNLGCAYEFHIELVVVILHLLYSSKRSCVDGILVII